MDRILQLITKIFLIGGALALLSANALASAYYVSPTGSDSNNGTSSSTPFLTLEKAQMAMQSSSIKTTYLMGGVYSRSATLTLGNADAGERWLAYPGQTPILDGGNTLSTGITVAGTSNVTIRWMTLRNFVGTAIGIYKVTGSLFDSNTIYNITGPALSNGAYTAKGIGIVIYGALISSTISHNLIYNTTNHGIHMTPDPKSPSTPNQNVTIDSNYIHDVNSYPGLYDTGGIYLNDRLHAQSGIIISNNEVANYGNTTTGIGARAIYLDDESSNVVIHDNVITGNGAWGLQIHGGNDVSVYNNVFDITLATQGIGVYQDDVSSGWPNYGMQNNVFYNNTIYMDCNTVRSLVPWYYADATNGGIAMLSDYSNTYYNLSSSIVNSGHVIDSSPSYNSGCASLQTLKPSLSTVGPTAH